MALAKESREMMHSQLLSKLLCGDCKKANPGPCEVSKTKVPETKDSSVETRKPEVPEEKRNSITATIAKLGEEICNFGTAHKGVKFVDIAKTFPGYCGWAKATWKRTSAGQKHFLAFVKLYDEHVRPPTPYRKEEFASMSTTRLAGQRFRGNVSEKGKKFSEASDSFRSWVRENERNLTIELRKFREYLSRL
jgi:hypothetical protein